MLTGNRKLAIRIDIPSVLLVLVCTCTILPLIFGCSKKTNAPKKESLPAVVAATECTTKPVAPEGCVWALSTDAVIWGTLLDVRLVESPSVLKHWVGDPPEWVEELVSDCDGVVKPAMEFDIRIETTLFGTLSGAVTVRVGEYQRSSYNPIPLLNKDGNIEWHENGSGLGGPLTPGQKIGLGIHYVPELDLWSLMGEPMFSVDSLGNGEEVVRFQRIASEYWEPSPVFSQDMSIDDLADAINDCSSSLNEEAAERKTNVEKWWGGKPEFYMAGICIPNNTGTGDPECSSDADCGPNELCKDGVCSDQ